MDALSVTNGTYTFDSIRFYDNSDNGQNGFGACFDAEGTTIIGAGGCGIAYYFKGFNNVPELKIQYTDGTSMDENLYTTDNNMGDILVLYQIFRTFSL